MVRQPLAPLAVVAALALACGGAEDEASDLDTEAASDAARARDTQKYVFVTSQAFTADLNGVRGADRICQRLARAAGLPGKYKAWLSDSRGRSPASSFTTSTLNYVLPDATNTVVANGWADLTDGTLDNPINVTETGAPVTGTAHCGGGVTTFTSTTPAGLPWGTSPDEFCMDFTTGDPSVNAQTSFGLTSATSSQWSFVCGGGGCGDRHPLYCFQQ